jgi:hypothetical protein
MATSFPKQSFAIGFVMPNMMVFDVFASAKTVVNFAFWSAPDLTAVFPKRFYVGASFAGWPFGHEYRVWGRFLTRVKPIIPI